MIKYIMIAVAAVGISTAAQADVTTKRLNQIMMRDALPFILANEHLGPILEDADDSDLPEVFCAVIDEDEVIQDENSEQFKTSATWSWVEWEIKVDCDVPDDESLAQTVVHELVHWAQSYNILGRKPSRSDRERLGGFWMSYYDCLAQMEGMAYAIGYMYWQGPDFSEQVVDNMLLMMECETDSVQPYDID